MKRSKRDPRKSSSLWTLDAFVGELRTSLTALRAEARREQTDEPRTFEKWIDDLCELMSRDE